jgi:hypothetical protein
LSSSTLAAFRFCTLCASRRSSAAGKLQLKKIIALKLCKQEQAVEESELSRQGEPIFHTLINTCVENLILQKYVLSSSAQLLPAATS